MTDELKKELENAMNIQAETNAAEIRGREMVMEKAGEIAGAAADEGKKVYAAIEKGVVDGYKAIENGVVGGYKAIENGVVSGFSKITDRFVGAFLTKEGETVEQARERLAAEQKAREQGR